jgi:hypothetical protein
MKYTIVPIEECNTVLARLRGRRYYEQLAFTEFGQKPDGDGWEKVPEAETNGDDVSLLWRRPFRASVIAPEFAE